jgi:hypothetical protein
MLTKAQYQDGCKFVSGAFFVASLISLYLYLTSPVKFFLQDHLWYHKSVGLRAIVYGGFFVITFYFGFLTKQEHSEN